MDKESLKQKQESISKRFDEVVKSKADMDDELRRLQGEYRLISELIEALDKPKRVRKVVENAQN